MSRRLKRDKKEKKVRVEVRLVRYRCMKCGKIEEIVEWRKRVLWWCSRCKKLVDFKREH